MREPRDTSSIVLYFDDTKVSIKARRDDSDVNPSGWSIIAFTPSASIRCVRGHQDKHLDLFIKSIISLANTYMWDSYEQIEEAIHKVTDREFDYE